MTLTGEPLLPSTALHDDSPKRFDAVDGVVAGVLWAVAFAVFIRARHYGFVFFDDQEYVAANAYVSAGLSWAGVKYAFTHRIVLNWHPLTTLTSELLATLFGPSPATFHSANVVLHAVAVALLYAVLRLATGRRGPAAAAAVLWGLHPLRVESVAWIAELKDELSSVLWLSCLLAYTLYAARRTPGRYAAVVALCLLACLAKPIAVALPFVLLLADYWPLGRNPGTDPPAPQFWGGRLLEKVPLLAMSAGTALIAISGQLSMQAMVQYPLSLRLANAVVSVVAYLRQTVWPTGLALFYPHPLATHEPIGAAAVIGGLALIGVLTAAAVASVRRRPYVFVGWFWFLIVLLPNLGLLQAGEQARADRFTLLPSIGLTVAVVWLVADWAAAFRARRLAAAAVGAGAIVALGLTTLALLPAWQNATTVWSHAEAVSPRNYMAESLLSMMSTQKGDPGNGPTGGETLARRSIASAREAAPGYFALSLSLAAQHREPEAEVAFDTALKRDPSSAMLHYQAGLFLAENHKDVGAKYQFERALARDPTMIQARRDLARVLIDMGKYAAAADQLEQCLAAFPRDATAEGMTGDLLRLTHDNDGAIDHYGTAVALGSTDWHVQSWLAWLVGVNGNASPGQLASTVGPAKAACDRTVGTEAFPLYAYSLVLARLDRFDDAVAAGEQALTVARKSGQAGLADSIATRLKAYRAGSPGGQPATTQPTTGPSATRPAAQH